jgi:hypothetical protein
MLRFRLINIMNAMISVIHTRCLILITALVATTLMPGGKDVLAQENGGKFAKHPAALVVQNYLRLALARRWKESAALIEPASLTTLRDSYAKRIVREGTTVEQEEAMVKKLGKTTPEEVAKMPPVDFYAAYNTALQERYDVTKEALTLISNSLTLRVLFVSLEGENLAHVLVRTSHRDHRNYVTNLELISLRKIKGKWLVALNEQAPSVVPLDEIDPVRKPISVNEKP